MKIYVAGVDSLRQFLRGDLIMRQKTSSILLVLAAGCMWGCMGLLVRPLNNVGLVTMDICFLRGFVAFVIMLAGLLVFDRTALKIRLKDIWCFVGTGALSVSFFNFCYFKTITLTSLSVAAVLLYTAPAFVMIMSFFLFKESMTKKKILALLSAFVGCVLVSLSLFFFWPHYSACRILVSLTGDWTWALAVKVPSPNHCTIRESLVSSF